MSVLRKTFLRKVQRCERWSELLDLVKTVILVIEQIGLPLRGRLSDVKCLKTVHLYDYTPN